MQIFISYFLQTDPNNKVIAPGDKEAANVKTTDECGIIGYHISQIKACEDLADKLKVKNIEYKSM